MEIKYRSYQAEMLDDDNIPADLLRKNLEELAFINQWLGGHRVSVAGLKKLLADKNQLYHVMDIGCGGGDTLKHLAIWAKKNDYKIEFIGLDIKEDAINFARESCANFPNIKFICQDYQNIPSLDLKIDIFIAALFCHHFDEQQIKNLTTIIANSCSKGFFINDLHRHWFAYGSIKILTKIFSKSVLVKNDAPLSVKRGFLRKEWIAILGDFNVNVEWKWAFRHLVVYKK